MGATTAAVSASFGCPAWIAMVSNRYELDDEDGERGESGTGMSDSRAKGDHRRRVWRRLRSGGRGIPNEEQRASISGTVGNSLSPDAGVVQSIVVLEGGEPAAQKADTTQPRTATDRRVRARMGHMH